MEDWQFIKTTDNNSTYTDFRVNKSSIKLVQDCDEVLLDDLEEIQTLKEAIKKYEELNKNE